MAYFSWMAREAALASSVELTVLAQAIDPNDPDTLLWDVFFPREDVPSVRINTLTPVVAKRWVSDRREWNARGRYIPQEFPGSAELEMIPIEDYFKMNEREMQHVLETTRGRNQQIFRDIVEVDVPQRTRTLVRANYRRIEVDTFNAWATGTITARNPVTGATYSMSYGFSGTRYQTAGVAWTGGSAGTAYNNFISWLQAGADAGMSIGGVMARRSTIEAIRTSAPNLQFEVRTDIPPNLRDLEARISDVLGVDFTFYQNERTVDIFTTGGLGTTQTKLWPAQTIAVVPEGERIGYNAFAPVARAFELSDVDPEAEIDVNGMTVYMETGGNGRELTVECQVNAMPVPDETRVWVMNAGI